MENNMFIYDAPNDNTIKPPLSSWNPSPSEIHEKYDLGVVVSFGYFLPKEIIEAFPMGAINLHPSLLPQYRGAAPIQKVLMNGERETGVSIISVDPTKFDSGDILHQCVDPIQQDDTFFTLANRLVHQGSHMLKEVIDNYEEYKENAKPQTSFGEKKVFARKIKNSDREIDLQKQTATNVWNYWRGLLGNGGIYTKLHDSNKRLRLIELKNPSNQNFDIQKALGYFHINKEKNRLFIECKDHTFVECSKVQVEGKKPVDAEPFIHGYLK